LPLAPLHVPGEAGAAHQPLHPLLADADPLLAQIEEDPARAVAAAAPLMHPADPLEQPSVGEIAFARRSPLPGVEARPGNAEHATQGRDRVVGLLRRDEPKAAHRVSLSRAKKTAVAVA